jgi:hypothetical protein
VRRQSGVGLTIVALPCRDLQASWDCDITSVIEDSRTSGTAGVVGKGFYEYGLAQSQDAVTSGTFRCDFGI